MPFSPPLLLIWAFQPTLFHTVVTEEDVFQKKSRAELFDCGLANDTSKVTQCWCASRRHHVFVLLGSVALDHLKINFAWLYQRLVLLSFKKTTVQEDYSTHQFACVFFFS